MVKLNRAQKEEVKKMLLRGESSEDIAEELNIGKMQVAGIKAHMTIEEREPIIESKSEVPTEKTPEPQVKVSSIGDLTPSPKSPNNTSILIGTDSKSNQKVYWDFNPDTGSINPHILIIGETGFGKTYGTQCIISELTKKNISTIVFDYGQGFESSISPKEFIELAHPEEIQASKNGISINPLKIFPDDMMGPVNVAQRTADTFARIYKRIGIQQREAIVEAVETVMKDHGIIKDDKTTWDYQLPQFGLVHDYMKIIAASDEHPMKRYAGSAASHIATFFRFNIIRNSGIQLHWDKMTENKKSWIIQLKGLEHRVSMVITELMLWNLISYLQASGQSKQRLFVVLDEAHKLSFDPGTPVEWLLREGRKFGVGVILASQQLEDYSKVAMANTATKIIFQNPDDRYVLSKALAKKCKNIPDYRKISEIITTIERGTAFIVNENVGRIVKILNLNYRLFKEGKI